MKESLKNLFDKLGLNKDNGLFLKGDNPKVNVRIEYSLKFIDYDALYILNDTPLIIFKEYENEDDYGENIDEFRKKIWNLNDIPVIFVIKPDEIEVYNANIFDDEDCILDKFAKNDNIDIFNVYNITSNSFFDKYKNSFEKSRKVENYLLDNIKETFKLLSKNLPLNIIHNLIGKLIFSKYLVDKSVFDENFFKEKYNKTFDDIILDKNELFDFFSIIEEKFNNELFIISQKDADLITSDDLNYLYNLFKGHDMKTGQSVLTCPYDFKIIPIELISTIYEEFLNYNNNETKSYYTPLFLVDYVLDKTMPDKNSCKILDPSCGSGIFLVESLRRLIEYNLKIKKKLTDEELKNILINNIYGIDIDPYAINITLLSIQLTVYDYLTNTQIESFEMPQLLNKNLFNDDFFNIEGKFNELHDFDLIVGNPPWGSIDGLHIEYAKRNNLNISNKQISESFLYRVRDFANETTEISQIVSSKILYNNNTKTFRRDFLENFKLKEVLELSPIRKKIFKNAIGPGCVLFYNTNINDKTLIKHISLKPNRLFYLLSSIVIQKNDITNVSQKDLKNNDFIWKILVYGTALDYQLINQIQNKNTFKKYMEKYDLKCRNGITVSNERKYNAKKYFNSNFLDVNRKNNMLNRYYIDDANVKKWNTEWVSRIRNENVFKPPYILVKKGLNRNFQCVATYSEKRWTFKDSVYSITGDKTYEKILNVCWAF